MLNLMILTAALAAAPDDPAGIAAPDLSPARFAAWFEAAQRGRLAIPDDVGRLARRYRYVLVNGLDIGMTQGCFAQNMKELRARGVPRDAIHRIDPSPRKTVAENADTMREEILEIGDSGPEPLVLIAHSRGACDTLAFALKNPRFVADRVVAVFLVQGPFGGSGAADYAAGEGSAVDRRMPPLYRIGARVIGRLEAGWLDEDKHSVIESFSRDASDRFWEGLLEAHREALPIVGPKVFYVTSHTRPSRHPLLQRVTAWYVDTYYGPNDGLVALEDQSLAGLGTVLAVLDAGHTDLTHRFPSARPQKKLRYALIDAIVMTVGSEARAEASGGDGLVPTTLHRQTRPAAGRRGRSPRK